MSPGSSQFFNSFCIRNFYVQGYVHLNNLRETSDWVKILDSLVSNQLLHSNKVVCCSYISTAIDVTTVHAGFYFLACYGVFLLLLFLSHISNFYFLPPPPLFPAFSLILLPPPLIPIFFLSPISPPRSVSSGSCRPVCRVHG